jgi:hypothetical protein
MTGLQFGDSPLDLSPSPAGDRDGIFWALRVFIYVSIILSVFNAAALRDWSDQLKVNQATEPVINVVHAWYKIIDDNHLMNPMKMARARWVEVKVSYLEKDMSLLIKYAEKNEASQ